VDYVIDQLPDCSVDYCGSVAAKRFSTIMESHGEVELFYCDDHFQAFETKLAEVIGLPRDQVNLAMSPLNLVAGQIRDVIDWLDGKAKPLATAEQMR